jgi:hypothetical protein
MQYYHAWIVYEENRTRYDLAFNSYEEADKYKNMLIENNKFPKSNKENKFKIKAMLLVDKYEDIPKWLNHLLDE